MLIITHRHTPKDIDSYSQYLEIDRSTLWSEEKACRSIYEIKKWCSLHRATALTSWGKDSIVMLHLLVKLRVNIPVVWIKFSDRYNPDCELVRDTFLRSFDIDYHEEIFDYKEVRKGDKHWKAVEKKYSPYRITGVRNDESKGRLIQYLVSGHNSIHGCRPLALWKSSEIFAYIEQNNLPLCPVYGYLGGGRWDRMRIRTHSIAGTTANGIGRTEWEKEYYPDLLRKVENHVSY
jgi:phosphoadenosine phosphosulfate reductase